MAIFGTHIKINRFEEINLVVDDNKNRLGVPISDDAQVRDGEPDTNFGTLSTLRVKTDIGGTTYQSFLKIDISSLSIPVTSATIKAIVQSIETADGSQRTISIRGVNDTTWTEETITWNTKPLIGTIIDSVVINNGDEEKEFEWDVTQWVNDNINNDFVSFVFTQDETATIGINLYSNEASAEKSIRFVVNNT